MLSKKIVVNISQENEVTKGMKLKSISSNCFVDIFTIEFLNKFLSNRDFTIFCFSNSYHHSNPREIYLMNSHFVYLLNKQD